jgi:hypothetical protein
MKTHAHILIFFLCFNVISALACDAAQDQQLIQQSKDHHTYVHRDATHEFEEAAIQAAQQLAGAFKTDLMNFYKLKIGTLDLIISRGIMAKNVLFISPVSENKKKLTQVEQDLLGHVVHSYILGRSDSSRYKITQVSVFLDEKKDAEPVYKLLPKS